MAAGQTRVDNEPCLTYIFVIIYRVCCCSLMGQFGTLYALRDGFTIYIGLP